MDAREPGNFGNDDASDWIYDLSESSGADLLQEAFSAISGHDYPEIPDCCIALAAAEIVACAQGKPPNDLPDEVRKWIGNQVEVATIKALRKQANLSQAVFAHYLNLTVGYVSQLERGVKRPTGPALVLLDVIRRKGIEAIL